MRTQMIFGSLLVGATAYFGAYATPQMDECSGFYIEIPKVLEWVAGGVRMKAFVSFAKRMNRKYWQSAASVVFAES